MRVQLSQAQDNRAIGAANELDTEGGSMTADDEPGIRGFLRLQYRDFIQRSTRAYWAELLRLTGGNVSAAAKIAGCSRESAHRILRKLHIDRPRLGPGAWKRLRAGRDALDGSDM